MQSVLLLATGLTVEGPEFESLSTSYIPVLRLTQPPIQWIAEAFHSEVKWPGHEAGHLPRTSAEVKKPWIYTSTPIRLYGVVSN
jgi:hypothetical protein